MNLKKQIFTMLRIVIILLVWVVIITLSGCDTHKSSEQTPLSDFKDNVFDFPHGDVTSLFVVALEDTHESYIGQIRELLFDDEYIFVLDGNTTSFLVFDIKGKFQARISAVGRGPGEYSQGIRSFDLDRVRKEIIIYDYHQRKLIRYTYGGQFLSENRLVDYRGMEFAYIGSDQYVFRLHMGDYEIVVTDSIGNILSVPHPRERKYDSLLHFPRSPFFAKTCSGIPYYIPMWDDKIYSVTPDGVLIVEDFGLKNEMLTDENDISIFKREVDRMLQRNYTGPAGRIRRYSFFRELVVDSANNYYVKNAFLDQTHTMLLVAGQFGEGVFEYGRDPDYLTSYTFSPGDTTIRGDIISSITDTLTVNWHPRGSYRDMFVIAVSRGTIRRNYPLLYNSLSDTTSNNPHLLFYKTIF